MVQIAGTNRIRGLVALLTKFLAGQTVVQALNLVTGLLILRFLSIEEYALYTIANLLMSVGSVGSDMGLSQAVVTLGAKMKDDRQGLSRLFSTARTYRGYLFFVASAVSLVVAGFITQGHGWSIFEIAVVLAVVLLSNWVQQTVSLGTSLLNVHHDSNGLFQGGGGAALARLMLVPILCGFWPTAISALTANFAGMAAGQHLIGKWCSRYIDPQRGSYEPQGAALKTFIYPLVPGIIYYLVQGQIGVFILGLYGYTSSIAEVGALGRLGQIVMLLILINGFFIQPYFARIKQKAIFVSRLGQVIAMLLLLSGPILLSALLLPDWWLLLLGRNYAGLTIELPIAVGGALAALIGSVLYTIMISLNDTRGQSWNIIIGLGAQLAFVSIYGVHTTRDALVLNVLPYIGYIFLQSALLFKNLRAWRA